MINIDVEAQFRVWSPLHVTDFWRLIKAHVENHSHCDEKRGFGGLPPENVLEVKPSKTSENAHLQYSLYLFHH